jgi:hypothetical protein
MPRVAVTALLLFGALGSSARTAAAQRADWPERVWVSVNGGIETATKSVSDAFSIQHFVEPEPIGVAYPSRTAGLVSVNGGYRLWNRLGAGVGVMRATSRGSANVTAQVPHPFFFNQLRQVQGTAHTSRTETSADVVVAYLMPLTDRVRVIVSGGPSVVALDQAMVTDVQVSQQYPYDTASFASATTGTVKKTAAGVNGGADVFWMLSRHFAAGALVRATHARVTAPRGAGTPASVRLTAGGAQLGAGLRVLF